MANDLKEIRDLFAFDTGEWNAIRDEGTQDMQYAAGDPWDPKDREDRRKAGRPCLSVDELNQYLNQVVNEVRSNKRAVKFTPIGDGATDQSAQFYADKMREIEYRSRAQVAYTTGFENCVTRSFGFVRVNTRYQSSTAVNQDLWIDPVPNPNLITPDSTAVMPDLSDMGHCWVREAWSTDDFNKHWPKAKIRKFTSDLGKFSDNWITDKRVFVGEYWKIQTKARTLLILQTAQQPDPIGIFEDELEGKPLPAGVTLLRSRKVDDPSVTQQLTNGVDILEENEWLGKYIPIIGCLGKVLYVSESGSEKRKILSMIRLAREPQMMLAYLATAEAETVGSLTKFPYFAYEGQLSSASLNAIARSLHEPVAVVQVKPYIEGTPPGSGPLGFPQRNPWTLDLASLEMCKESFRRAIQSAMGQTPLPTAAQRRNEKSGVALQHIAELGQQGSYHFTDHYLDMITQVGIVCEDLIDKVYDTPRDTGIRKDDDTAAIVRINDPSNPTSVQTKGTHLVTVSTGMSFESERDAANEFASSLLDSPLLQMLGPQKGPQIIAKAIKLKNLGPIGDQMCDIIAPQPGKDGQPTPEQMTQELQQTKGHLQELQGHLQQATQIIQTDQVKQQAGLDKAKIDQHTDLEKAKIDGDVRVRVAGIQAEASTYAADVKAGIADMQVRIAQMEALIGVHADAASQVSDQQHEVGMAAVQHAHALAQGQQAGAQQLAVNQQQADLQPAPEAGP